MKKLTPFFLLFCLAFCLTACETKGPDRESTTTTITTTTHEWDENVNYVAIPDGVEFGMTEDKIRSILSNKTFEQYDVDTIVTYISYSQDPIFQTAKRQDHVLSFGFGDNSTLYRVGYVAGLYQEGEFPVPYTDYSTAIEYLKLFYGDPINEKAIWQNDLYKDDSSFSSKNTAVHFKHVYYFAEWQVDNYYCLATSVPEGGISIAYYSDRKYMPFPYLYM